MRYVPMIFSMDGELDALQNQNFSNDISPFIQIVKDIKKEGGKASILDDIKNLISSKSNTFFLTVPRNYDLSKKKLKKPIDKFYRSITSDPKHHSRILNKFNSFDNVIPVIEVNLDNYSFGDLKLLKNSLSFSNFCYRVDAKSLNLIEKELSSLITNNDFLLYDLKDLDFSKKSIKDELKVINSLKNKINFKTIVIKQIYKELTFYKLPNGIIKPRSTAHDCIDSDFYSDYTCHGFDSFGDWAGIRNNPIYAGGLSYPAYLTIELDKLEHHAFIGTPKDVNSFETVLLPNYLASDHWNIHLSSSHKSNCYGCNLITLFKSGHKCKSATKWKIITVSHFISSMDYKLTNKII